MGRFFFTKKISNVPQQIRPIFSSTGTILGTIKMIYIYIKKYIYVYIKTLGETLCNLTFDSEHGKLQGFAVKKISECIIVNFVFMALKSRRGQCTHSFVQLHYLCSERVGHFPVIRLISVKHTSTDLLPQPRFFQSGRRLKTPSVSRLHKLSDVLLKNKKNKPCFLLTC